MRARLLQPGFVGWIARKAQQLIGRFSNTVNSEASDHQLEAAAAPAFEVREFLDVEPSPAPHLTNPPAAQKDWHPAQIKAALEMAGTNLSQLAKQHNYIHINDVLHRPWLAAEVIVAKALEKKPEEIWPSRYQRSRARAQALTRKTIITGITA